MSEQDRPPYERDANGAVRAYRDGYVDQIVAHFRVQTAGNDRQTENTLVHRVGFKPLPAGLPGAHIASLGLYLRQGDDLDGTRLSEVEAALVCRLAQVDPPDTELLVDDFVDPHGELAKKTLARRARTAG